MTGLVADLVRIAFQDDVPEAIHTLWPPDGLAERHALAFKACPILPVRGQAPARIYVSNGFEDESAFLDRLLDAWPDDRIAAFFQQLGPEVRKILDTDGHTVDLFLDDLQESDHNLPVPASLDLLATNLHIPTGRRTVLTRHGLPPWGLLDDAWTERLNAVLDADLFGHWSVRWGPEGVQSLLWVNEDRFRGDPEASAQALDAMHDARWDAMRARAAQDGLRAYPDGIEVKPSQWDVTVGLFDPADPASKAVR